MTSAGLLAGLLWTCVGFARHSSSTAAATRSQQLSSSTNQHAPSRLPCMCQTFSRAAASRQPLSSLETPKLHSSPGGGAQSPRALPRQPLTRMCQSATPTLIHLNTPRTHATAPGGWLSTPPAAGAPNRSRTARGTCCTDPERPPPPARAPPPPRPRSAPARRLDPRTAREWGCPHTS